MTGNSVVYRTPAHLPEKTPKAKEQGLGAGTQGLLIHFVLECTTVQQTRVSTMLEGTEIIKTR